MCLYVHIHIYLYICVYVHLSVYTYVVLYIYVQQEVGVRSSF